jgi:tartrate-resistant acid phosphatase type 5
MFSGHEHNFQHSRHNGIDYFITGAAGKVRKGKPSRDDFEAAHTVSWAGAFHFLIVTIEGNRMIVQPFTERHGQPHPLTRATPEGEIVAEPIVITS